VVYFPWQSNKLSTLSAYINDKRSKTGGDGHFQESNLGCRYPPAIYNVYPLPFSTSSLPVIQKTKAAKMNYVRFKTTTINILSAAQHDPPFVQVAFEECCIEKLRTFSRFSDHIVFTKLHFLTPAKARQTYRDFFDVQYLQCLVAYLV